MTLGPSRRLRWWLSTATLIAALAGLGYWIHQWQTGARRMAAWREQQAELAEPDPLEKLVTLRGGRLALADFAALVREQSGQSVEIDEPAIAAIRRSRPKAGIFVCVSSATLSLRSALRNALQPVGLEAAYQEGRILITAQGSITNLPQRITVVYPLPQPEPAGMDAEDWHWSLVGYLNNKDSDIQAVPGAVVVVASPEEHRRIRQVIDAICHLDEPRPQPVVLPPPPLGDMQQRILAELERPTVMEFVETPLVDAVAYLTSRHDIPIILRVSQLNEAGVNIDAPVTKNLTDISLRSALSLLLKELDLTMLVRDDALFITTPDDAESHLEYVAYPVQELVQTDAGPDFDSLIRLIQSTVSEASWDDVGGPGSLTRVGDGWLLVSQTGEVHRQLRDLLGQLQAQSKAPAPAPRSVGPGTLAEARVRPALSLPISLAFAQSPLKDAVTVMQKQLGIPIVLNAKTLTDAGINLDAPVTCNLPAGQAAMQLTLLLEQLDLTFVIRDEVVQITTHDDAETQLEMRLFHVRPLLGAQNFAQRLCDLVVAVNEPLAWDSYGGPGEIQHFRGLLVVTQRADLQGEVQRLLVALHEHILLVDPAAPAAPSPIRLAPNPHGDRLDALLDKPEPVSLPALPLLAALHGLATEHNIPIVDDTKALHDAGLLKPGAVMPAINAPTPRQALNQLLATPDLGWIVRDHVIFVTTTRRIEQLEEVRLYCVGDLAAKARPAVALRRDLCELSAGAWSATIETIDPDWLIIRASQPSHRKIEAWFEEQRKVVGTLRVPSSGEDTP